MQDQSRERDTPLEQALAEATEALRISNERLERESGEHRAARLRIEEDQSRLRRLATALSLAEARERREIAVALHDGIIQEFAFIKLRIAQFRGDSVFHGLERNLDEILSLLERGIRQMRELTFDLSPPVLYDLGLSAAVEWLAERCSDRHGLRVALELDLPRPEGLPEALRVTAFKCVQELLTNVIKYAGAPAARLSLRREGARLLIVVADEGAGFDPETITGARRDLQGFGLFSIRERIRSLGGEMSVQSAPGHGTSVCLAIPVEG